MSVYPFLSIPVGYLLGSTPSTYIVGCLLGKTDMRSEGDGRISAAAVYQKLGRLPYALVLLLDIGKGALSVIIANLLTDSMILVLLSGFAAVVAHCWSFFMRFRGGLGATVICGVLLATVFLPLIIGLAVGALVMVITRKSGFSSGVTIVAISTVLFIQYLIQSQSQAHPLDPVLIIYPIALILIMVLKRLQVNRTGKTIADISGAMDQSESGRSLA